MGDRWAVSTKGRKRDFSFAEILADWGRTSNKYKLCPTKIEFGGGLPTYLQQLAWDHLLWGLTVCDESDDKQETAGRLPLLCCHLSLDDTFTCLSLACMHLSSRSLHASRGGHANPPTALRI